ncbi:hypothetical protein BH11BAC2_BH11BAC2_01450 [soil metagenome]
MLLAGLPTILELMFGMWRATLALPDASLPFNFDLLSENGKNFVVIRNANERIRCDDVTISGDSIFIKFPVYDSEIRAKVERKVMNGVWINRGRKGSPQIPFQAVHGVTNRFFISHGPVASAEGRWETWFDPGTPDSSLAIGVFTQTDEKVKGTFLTETGDHRYIEGVMDGDSLKMSVFDGSHCWLYLAKVSASSMDGMFYSGNHFKGKFHAVRNNDVALRNPDAITTVSGLLNFRFADADSNLVSLTDPPYRNKPVIIQILGTWCPNCMDETAFLSAYYNEHKADGFEVIGLAFERFPDFATSSANVKRMIKRYKVEYPVLIAGVSGADNVMKTLPAIKNFISFPTTLFVDRNGRVVKVHAGFSGPATGPAYEEFKAGFNQKMNLLLR